ncbi:hypothetical protein QBC35DRAFT_546371 [Podospora australis]|uniref:N-acetyltransferase domain-containing protein n=1 Tax=Podospora australis TaxID=1536484 RepID=A0AAN6WJZ9_9PEZI|nr:hypothetical protein QBC35DRAFT_546371 [Podospora australis]
MATPLSDYPFALEPVFIADSEHLARAVESPASESGPLFYLMFPYPGVDFSEQQNDEIIRWHAEGIRDAIIGGQTCLRKIRQGDGTLVGLAGWKKSENWLPGALDVSAWFKVSAALKKERQRVIGHLDNGLGSMLMQHILEDIDRHDRYGYVLASPAGVRLYSKFGFEVVGQVDTPYGPITSMLRRRQTHAFSLDQRRLRG